MHKERRAMKVDLDDLILSNTRVYIELSDM